MEFSTTYDEVAANRLFAAFIREHKLDTCCDACDEKIIPGPVGGSHIYAFDNTRLGVMFMPDPKARYSDAKHKEARGQWNEHRRALEAAGCSIHQDCDGEGTAIFDPTDIQQVKTVFQVVSLISHKGR